MRRLLSNLGQCFVQVENIFSVIHDTHLESIFNFQLVHKSQTIFQTNAKLEAELLHLREELSVAQATLCRTGLSALHIGKKFKSDHIDLQFNFRK